MTFLRPRNRTAAFLFPVALLSWGCQDDAPRVVTAQFADENHDGRIQAGETILLGLDRPLVEGYLETHRVRLELSDGSDPLELTPLPSSQRQSEVILEIASASGELASRASTVLEAGEGSPMIRLSFIGSAPGDWIDLTYVPSHPVLERVLWEDRPGEHRPPNLTVDRGDALRLLFDRPVKLAPEDGSTGGRVRVPDDVRLASETDQLDDGRIPSLFEAGDDPREILIILGSRPLLTIDEPPGTNAGGAALRPPSALAVSGTRIFPSRRLVDARGEWGAISTHAVSIELAEDDRRWEAIGWDFPPPGHRIHHTVTPISRGRALIVGGRAIESDDATDQVLVFDPAAIERGENPLELALPIKLPEPISEHTATLLAGPDEITGTDDDLVVVIGGKDEERRALGTITVFQVGGSGVRLVGSSAAEGESPGATGPEPPRPWRDLRLRVPRWGHRAVAVGPLRVLVDGGRTRGAGASGLVGCAELLTFEVQPGGAVTIADGGHTTFRTVPRFEHSLTLLAADPADVRARYVLAYGGFGEYRPRPAFPLDPALALGAIFPEDGDPPPDIYFPDHPELGAVLVSPVLLDLDDPTRSFLLDYEFNYALLRRGHDAVLLPGGDTKSTVLIAGGISSHLTASRNRKRGWEIPTEALRSVEELIRRMSRGLPITPRGYEAGNAVLFTFDHQFPERSSFSVVTHPAPDDQMVERIHQAHAVVPGIGILLLGGQLDAADEQSGLRLGDMYLEESGLWRPMAPSLTVPRWGHRAYVVEGEDGPTVYVIGGRSDVAPRDGFHAVEELRIR